MKSIEVGGRLLDALVNANGPLTLKDLAARARLSPSAAHRYLVSYQRLGLVSQDRASRRYDIGSFGLQLGVAAVGRSRLIASARELQTWVRDRLDESVILATWGSYGPVIVSAEESSKPVIMTMRVGATLPLFRTATGWIFAAFMPKTVLQPVIRRERSEGRGPIGLNSARKVASRLDEIRRLHFAAHSGHLLPGVSAVAVPLLDATGGLVAAISVFGSSDRFDTAPTGLPAKVLAVARAKFSGQAAGQA